MAAGAQENSIEQAVLPYGVVLSALATAAPEQVALVCDGVDGAEQLTRAELEA